jgi:glycosyltransferase involved in cell wall biosynthesis
VTTISVVIPAFNRAHVIAPAIDSALAQRAAGCEIDVIVVDDGSSDNLADVLMTYGSRVACIRHDRNSGAAAARNTGVTAASGDFVAFLDSDDEWLPRKLEKQLAAMRHQQWAASCTAYYLVRRGAVEVVSPKIATGALNLVDVVWGCFVSPGSTLMFERSAFAEVGPFDSSLGRLEDWDWLLRYARTHTLGFVTEPLARISASVHRDATPVLAAIEALRRKHAAELDALDRRHFEAALAFERAAALYRSGRMFKAVAPFLWSLARSPTVHPALAAVLHNRFARA